MNDIQDLEKKIKKLSSKTKKEESNSKSSSSLGMAMKLSSEMVAAVFVASLIGYYIGIPCYINTCFSITCN